MEKGKTYSHLTVDYLKNRHHNPICHRNRLLPTKASAKTRVTARVNTWSRKLVGPNPMAFFATNCVEVITDWISLLRVTTLPSDIRSSDTRIINAFKAVDSIICGKATTYRLRRLAYVQLTRIFTILEYSIKSERESKQVHREPCRRDASVALDIYMMAQEDCGSPSALRRALQERKRTSRSWNDMAGPSPLFTMMYSEAAEQIVYVFALGLNEI